MNPTPKTLAALHTAATSLASALFESCQRIVFAESCTAGLVPATLATTPGISQHLCGSAVTYRNDTKHRWIAVGEDVLTVPGPVSEVVAKQMAVGVLELTPEADFAASITGHLGPDAPVDLDGVVYLGVATRSEGVRTERHQIRSPGVGGDQLRIERQYLAAALIMKAATAAISQN